VSVSILIVDDSASIRRSLRSCIEANPEWSVCGEAENGHDAVHKVKVLNPDFVILDWLMPVMGGLEAARQINHIAPNTAMLMLTLHGSEQLLQEAHAVGVQRVFSKSERLDALTDWLKNSVHARRS
jgi:two-component system, NarL family, response regulator LiaR